MTEVGRLQCLSLMMLTFATGCQQEAVDCSFFWYPPEPATPNSIQFFNDSVGIVRDFRTDDGANSWRDFRPPGLAASRFYFASPEVMWAADFDGNVLRSVDGGVTFSTAYSTTRSQTDLAVLDVNVTWALVKRYKSTGAGTIALSSDSQLLRTTDGGQTFTDINRPALDDFWAAGIHFFSTSTGMLWRRGVSGYEIHRTSDGGVSWTLVYSSTANFATRFASSGSTVMAGAKGNDAFLRSTDSGVTWTELGSQSLVYLDLRDASTAFILSDYSDGNLLQTTDGGLNWITLEDEVRSMDVSGDGSLWYSTSAEPGQIHQMQTSGVKQTFEVPTTDAADRPVSLYYETRSGCMF